MARRARAKQYTKIGYGANEDHPDLEVRISIFFFEIFFPKFFLEILFFYFFEMFLKIPKIRNEFLWHNFRIYVRGFKIDGLDSGRFRDGTVFR